LRPIYKGGIIKMPVRFVQVFLVQFDDELFCKFLGKLAMLELHGLNLYFEIFCNHDQSPFGM